MVFFSTLQALLGTSTPRSVFAFGTRRLTVRILLEDVTISLFLALPLAILVAFLNTRLTAKRPIKQIRADVWTTLVITLVGDIFLEFLLPSVKCLPLEDEFQDDFNLIAWLLQVWGMRCPTVAAPERWLTPEAAGTLLTIRLLFLCLGVYFGESFVPIALTGGIASGKSTVAQLLLKSNKGDDSEGSVMLVDTDEIAHEILLSPETLKSDPKYIIPPSQSVYHDILEAFEGHDILDEDRLNIDRRKLGAIIFQDADKRRLLNRITHPRIILVMMHQTLSGIFSNDIVCVDVPLLFESGLLKWMYAVTIVVACDANLQYQRLRERNPDLTESQCRDRINSQFPLEKKAAMADIVIWNNGSVEDLELSVQNVKREVFQRLYGIGMSLLQMLLLVGGSLCLAVSWNVFSTN